MATVTVSGRTTVKSSSSSTIPTVRVLTPPPYGAYSLHDCIDPGQVTVHNMVWPINMAGGHNNGIVIHTKEPGGSFSVTFS